VLNERYGPSGRKSESRNIIERLWFVHGLSTPQLALAGRHASIRDMHDPISGSDVVVAIIGGTLLGLALTRPRFGWVERLDDSSRRYAEVVTTIVAFVMGGYAYGALFIVLHRQLGGDIDKLLWGAGFFFGLYAACVHFEPFSEGEGWRERGSAMILYVAVALAAMLGGVVFVEYTLSHSVSSWPTLVKAALLLLVACLLYWLARRSKPDTTDDPTLEGGTAEPLPETLE
jgi:hypothetical protein